MQRYVEGLSDLRPDHPERLMLTAIVGVPTDLDGAGFDTILAHPRMQERVDPEMPDRAEPSCEVPGRGLAFPPRRIVRTARELREDGVATTVGSICRADLTPAVDPMLRRLADAVDARCR